MAEEEITNIPSQFLSESHDNIKLLSDVTPTALKTIQDLDLLSHRLSKRIDTLVLLTNNTNIKQSDINIHEEIKLLRLALEDIFTKKLSIAMDVYDIIDQQVTVISQIDLTLSKMIEPTSSSSIAMESTKSESSAGYTNNTDTTADPEEPLYCICKRGAHGEMIACDNEQCNIEWFHYSCVGLTTRPTNEWMCRSCSAKSRSTSKRVRR